MNMIIVSKKKFFLAALFSLTSVSCAEFDIPFAGFGSTLPVLSISIPSNDIINSGNLNNYIITGSCSLDGARVYFSPALAPSTICSNGVFAISNTLTLQKIIITNFCTTEPIPPVATQDPNFASGGFFQYNSSGVEDNSNPFSATRVTYDSTGRIYGVAYAPTGSGGYDDLILIRLNQEDGSYDNTFQTNGIGRLDLGYDARGISIAHSNNELYVSTNRTGIAPQVLNFNLNGNLDLTFAKDGIFDNLADLTGDGLYINNGIIYHSGHNSSFPHFKNITALDQTTGDPINTFGNSGLLSTNSSLLEQFGHAMSFTNDQSEFYSASEYASSGFKFRVSKHNSATGALVSSFGTNGVLSLDPGTDLLRPSGSQDARARHTIVHPVTGDIFVMGTFEQAPQNGIIYKLDSNGTVDNTWGVNGVLEIVQGSIASPRSFIFHPTGNYIFLRTRNGSANEQLTILKVDDQGAPDLTFGSAGYMSYAWPALASARVITAVTDINGDLLISFNVRTNAGDSDLGIIRICM